MSSCKIEKERKSESRVRLGERTGISISKNKDCCMGNCLCSGKTEIAFSGLAEIKQKRIARPSFDFSSNGSVKVLVK